MARKQLTRYVLVDTDVLDAYQEAIRKAPSRARRAAGLIARGDRAQRLLSRLATYPPKPSYPLRWKSAKQRRYVMAKLRRENNLPYQRTGELGRSYGVSLYPNGEISLTTISPYYQYVQGEDQQPFHIDTGWEYVPAIVAEEREGFSADMIDAWGRIMEV